MAVGFELATGWNIYQDKQDSSGQYLKCAKGAVLLTHPSGWKLTADGVEIEFVIDPVQETNVGEAFVKVAFGALRRFIDDLNAKKAQAEVRAADLPRWFPPGKSKFVIIPDGHDIAALPQVTGGIRLARIRRLMRILSDDQSEAAKTFFGNYTAAYTSAMGAVAIPHAQIRDSNWVHVPSAKLRGLVTLIAFYIRQFKTTAPGQSVYAAKYRTVLMSRTKFSAMFEELPDDERTHYRQNPNAWVQFICSDIMSRVTGGVGVAPDGYLVEFLISDQGTLAGTARVQLPLTRRQWLVGMLHGKDLLSAAANPIKWHSAESKRLYKDTYGVGHRLRGLAGLGDKLDPGPNGEVNYATIIEFRATQKRVPYTEWQNYAIRMYRFIVELNEGTKTAALDLQ